MPQYRVARADYEDILKQLQVIDCPEGGEEPATWDVIAVEIQERDNGPRSELVELLRELNAAAQGDSNDTEIEAAQGIAGFVEAAQGIAGFAQRLFDITDEEVAVPEKREEGSQVPVAELVAGDMVDLQNDPWADPEGTEVIYEYEYAVVAEVTVTSGGAVEIEFESGEAVSFPATHTLEFGGVATDR